MRLLRLPFVAAAATAFALAGCGRLAAPLYDERRAPVPRGPLEAPRSLEPKLPAGALVAYARPSVSRVPAFRNPWRERPFAVFENPDQYLTRRVFLVKDVGDERIEAYLPMRPNGVTGWLRADDVVLRRTDYRITVDLTRNVLATWDGDRRIMRETVAAGTGGTPTPTGLFYTTIEYRTQNPAGAYGPYIVALSAYSEVLFSFAGGDGLVGLHGTNNPSLLGGDVSHGCIRMRNEAITKIVRTLPLGTPVRITA
ncbi:MAG TPA: L,D-transpeptidase [Actinomycetota bacterium]|nr:L,D-transpeptidase [Actinomycetota bacterium]